MQLGLDLFGIAVAIIGISLTGVLSPGPMLAVTISESVKRGFIAGPLVALGHLLVEAPTVIILWIGLSALLELIEVKIFIGLLGGMALIYMGQDSVRGAIKARSIPLHHALKGKAYGPFIGGIVTSAFSPLFIAWWMVMASVLLPMILPMGLLGLLFLLLVHWPLDIIWYSLISYSVEKARKKIVRGKAYQLVVVLCGILLLAFGAYFLTSTAVILLRL